MTPHKADPEGTGDERVFEVVAIDRQALQQLREACALGVNLADRLIAAATYDLLVGPVIARQDR